MLEKIQRINQLKEWGYNTPRIMQIDYGTKVDDTLKKELISFVGNDEKMTIRTYSYRDELREFKTEFYPEIPANEAIHKIKDLANNYNVLFQEAVDVNTTLITGNVALTKEESGFFDILKGRFRVRDVDKPPPGAKRISEKFNWIRQIKDSDLRNIVYEMKDIPFLVPYKEGVIVEFDLHEEGVGEKNENLILWEFRPMG